MDLEENRQPSPNAQEVDQQRDARVMGELYHHPESLGIKLSRKNHHVKKVAVVLLGHESIPIIHKFLDKYFPKQTTPSKNHIIGIRYPSNVYPPDDLQSPAHPSIKNWIINKGDCIGFSYECKCWERRQNLSKPILKIVDVDYIPFDVNFVITRRTQFDILNEKDCLSAEETKGDVL